MFKLQVPRPSGLTLQIGYVSCARDISNTYNLGLLQPTDSIEPQADFEVL